MTEHPEWDLFISHASEDKDFVRPLAEALRTHGVRVWYDEFELKPAMNLQRSINKGLAESRYGVVVLSYSFLTKGWTQAEFDMLITRQIAEGREVIIPLYHGVTVDDVRAHSLLISNIIAIHSGPDLDEIVRQLLNAMHSEGIPISVRSAMGVCYRVHQEQLGVAESSIQAMETSEYGRDGFGQHFERGSIYWSERGGAHRVFGGIGERYQEFDGVQGRLGYPLTDELTSGRSPQGTTGVFQRFEGARDYPDEIDMNPVDRAGATIYWSESLGAHVTWDAIGKLYERGGGTTGELGFPTSSPKEAKPQTGEEGYFQRFEGGTAAWTPVGAFSILGAINALYVHLGGSRGQFGFPIGPEGREEIDDSGPVLMQQFEGGSIAMPVDRSVDPKED